MGDEFYKHLALNPLIWVEKKDRGVPEKYIINQNAVILIWKGGEKTVIKRRKEDEFDAKLGFLTAFFQHYSGLNKHKANEYLANLEVQDSPNKIEENTPNEFGKDDSNKFEIGDIVEVVEGDTWNKKGWIGQIVETELDNKVNNLKVEYENGESWWVSFDQLKLIRREKANEKN